MFILAQTPIAERETILKRRLTSYGQKKLQNLKLVHLEGNIQGTFREHSGNIQGAFREHSGNIQGTFREQG
jgi:hypothetical protein